MNQKADVDAGGKDDMLVGMARTIGTALGTVVAKISPARKTARTSARKGKISKIARAAKKSTVGIRSSSRSRTKIGRSKAK